MGSRSNTELREDKNGNRTGARPRVGEADAATRRRMLDQRLNERQPPSSRPATKPAPSRPAKQPDAFSAPRAANDLRYRGTRVDDAVNKNSR